MRPVLIQWESTVIVTEWLPRNQTETLTPARCNTVGWLIGVTQTHVRVALSLGSGPDGASATDERCGCATVIPIGAIAVIHRLEQVQRPRDDAAEVKA